MNRSVGCSSARTFRLASFSEQRLIETVAGNLECLLRILAFNDGHGLLFFRLTSDLIPFASHPIMLFDWQDYFAEKLKQIGDYVKAHDMRISMHPDQFTLLNSRDERILANSIRELTYHADVLDALELDVTAKVQIHIGGVYGDKRASIKRFVERYDGLDDRVKRRLVIENDDRLYTLRDCLEVSDITGTPVVFDSLHHEVNNEGETLADAFAMSAPTWREVDGPPMVDYSSQAPHVKPGKHTESIDTRHFQDFLEGTREYDFDIMLEIKDKEKSAGKAVALIKNRPDTLT